MAEINNSLVERITRKFTEKYNRPPQAIARAPGRVNLLGEHVDYNDGFVMPAAIQRATYVAFSPSPGQVSTLLAEDFAGDELTFTRDSLPLKKQNDLSPLPDWGLYPAGVAWAFLQLKYPVVPIQAVFASDVPRGAGLSSSASVEAAFSTAWQHLGGVTITLMEQAALCLQAESTYVGVHCGIMDQFASLCGVENHLLQLDCRSLAWSTVPIPEHLSIVIADTRIPRSLHAGAYNQRRMECEQAVELLQVHLPSIRSLRDVTREDFEKYAGSLPKLVGMRARHVVEEIHRTQQAKTCLEQGDAVGFGRLMNACHASLRDLYDVSCLELEIMVGIAHSLPGCLGARLTGAGFGGCTVNLVENQYAEAFVSHLETAYREKTGLAADVFITRAAAGAGIV